MQSFSFDLGPSSLAFPSEGLADVSVLGQSGSDVLPLGHQPLDYYEFKKECQRAAVRSDSARIKLLQDPGSLKGVEVEHPGP